MLPTLHYVAVLSPAVALLSPLWLATLLVQQPLWLHLSKQRGTCQMASAAVCATVVTQLLETQLFLLLLHRDGAFRHVVFKSSCMLRMQHCQVSAAASQLLLEHLRQPQHQ